MDGEIVIVAPRAPEGLSLILKPSHGSRVYRLIPIRDPAQPRFWCLVVCRCTRGGVVDPEEVPWVVAEGLSRDLLRETLKEIEADLALWLDQPERHGLRSWMLERVPDPPLLDGRAEARKRPAQPADPGWEGGDDLFVAIDETAAPDLAAAGADRP